MTTGNSSQSIEHTEWACLLSPELLAALIAAPGAAEDWTLRAVGTAGTDELEPRRHDCGPAADGSNHWWLITARLPDGVGDQLERLEVIAPGRAGGIFGGLSLATPAELASACRARFDSEQLAAIQAFLLAAPAAHGLPPSAERSAALCLVRDELREQLPRTALAPGPLSARIEHVTAIDRHGFWLVGWIHDAAPAEVRLIAISPEGDRGTVRPAAITFHDRPAYSQTLEDDETVSTLGYYAYVEVDTPSLHPRGWIVEFHTAAGESVEDELRDPVGTDGEEVLERIRELLRDEPEDAMLSDLVLPAMSRLRGGEHEGHVEEVVEYGETPNSPEISVVIAVRRVDRIEHQLSQFARDPELRTAELIYVASEPPSGDDLATIAEDLYELYEIPFRMARLTRPAGRPRALNLGTTLARAPLIVLTSSDVLPADPGWLGRLRDAYLASSGVAAVGPKLLHEDDSIAHAGAEYAVRGKPPRPYRLLPFAGLAKGLDAANSPRRVQALSDACMLLGADDLRASGGFTELYLGFGDEAGDLCLRLEQQFGEIWYAPEAELYLLDRPDIPRRDSPVRDRYNNWLFERRCGGKLAASERRQQGERVSPPGPPRERPQTKPESSDFSAITSSGRSGPPIEELSVTPSVLDPDGPVLDSALLLPEIDEERSMYVNTYSFAITGWALGRDAGPVTVEATGKGLTPRRVAATMPSEVVGKRFPDVPGADGCAFQFVFGSLSLPLEFELNIEAVTADGNRTQIGTVSGTRRPVRSGFQPTVQPLLVTMLGRTGSNWLITLLSRHPDIVAYSTFVYEPMLASYWSAVLRTLSDPASYIQAMVPELYEGDWWTGSERRSPLPLRKPRNEMAQWFGRENVEVMAGFCQSRLDAFYTELARVEGRGTPRYFVEKCTPGNTARTVAELYPDSREIVLVRDFRDRICSILDYNAKRGLQLWGRDQSETDEQWFAYLRAEAMDLLENWRERRDSTLLVRYEDIIQRPEITLHEMFTYLDIDAGEDTVAETIERANALLPEAQRKHQTSASVEESVGRWRRDLSPERQAACATAFDDILVEFGYEPTGEIAAARDEAGR